VRARWHPEELGEVGRHRRDLADDPHRDDDGFGETVAAELGEVLAGDDAELGGERLEQHRHEIGQHDDPEQAIAVARAGLDIGREIARIDIGDRGHHGGTQKGQKGTPAVTTAGKRLAYFALRTCAQIRPGSGFIHRSYPPPHCGRSRHDWRYRYNVAAGKRLITSPCARKRSEGRGHDRREQEP